MTPTARTQQILTDATTIATLINTALHNLDLGLAGWPTTTPGASPTQAHGAIECPNPNCNQSIPCDLHSGNLPYDKASNDLDQLHEALRQTAHHAAIAAILCQRWGYTGLDETTIKARLVTIDALIWCTNCGRHGFKAPRLEGKTECEFCADFRRSYNRPAPKEILEIRSYRRLSVQDIERTLDRLDPCWRKKQKKVKVA